MKSESSFLSSTRQMALPPTIPILMSKKRGKRNSATIMMVANKSPLFVSSSTKSSETLFATTPWMIKQAVLSLATMVFKL